MKREYCISDELKNRPNREEVIQQDEITGLIIDLNTLSSEEINNIYFK